MPDSADRDDSIDFGYESVPIEEKTGRVRAVFDRVASRYDLMNDVMSAGVHRAWKDIFVTQLAPRPDMTIADLAGGTGDIALRILKRARRGQQTADVTVIDINEQMLVEGRERPALQSLPDEALHWVCGNAECLPFADRSLDALTIAFGIRNVTHRLDALKDIARVLKPGGRFLCLEFSEPVVPVLDTLYERYSLEIIPRLGEIVAGDKDSYQYLVESIRRFPNQTAFASEIEEAGLSRVRVTNLTGGVAAIHSAWAV